MRTKKKAIGALLMACAVASAADALKPISAHPERVENTVQAPAALWREPADLAARNLFYGPGGEADQPHGRFFFVKEDLDGSTPKFTVRDEGGVKWKVKLGAEARPETAASRLVWAVGYSVTEDYLLPSIFVEGMPEHLQRGDNLMTGNGAFLNVRLKRERPKADELGTWSWRENPFTGTRELNGLRVLMAVINNWDLKDVNNAIEVQPSGPDGSPERVYLIKDLGASFGATHLEVHPDKEKGNLELYRDSQFIQHLKPEQLSFATPGRPTIWALIDVPQYFMRLGLRWIGRDIPRTDAAWMGGLLGRLSRQQIADAFRAAGYSPDQVEGFTQVLEERIMALNQLSEEAHDVPFYPSSDAFAGGSLCCAGAAAVK